MANVKPNYSVQIVNVAGRKITEFMLTNIEWTEDVNNALDVIDNWRVSHNVPLHSLHITLKNRATSISAKAITAQRIKRLPSIALKLLHEKEMKLSQMQDIGGCRAIMPTIDDVFKLRSLYKTKPVNHTRGIDKDYIAKPKETGYRGIHLKYRFSGKGSSMPWNGLKVEIQLRTQLQHKWATAVEAAATFTDAALKSNQGSKEWLRFFALMSSIFALREGYPTVPGTPDNYDELCNEIRVLNSEYHIQSAFAQYHIIIPKIEKYKGAKSFLVTLDPVNRVTVVRGFGSRESRQANEEYKKLESIFPKTTQVVLVSVSSVSALKRAYPNYFLDTQDFLREVSDVTGIPV